MIFLILLCFTGVLVFLLSQLKRPENYPPGPKWLPLIGNIKLMNSLSLRYRGHYLALSELAKTFKTNVLGLKLGADYVVAVFSYQTVRTVLTSEVYEGRPDNFFIRLRCFGKRRGVTCVDGSLWSTQRSFVMRHLRNLGYGKVPMESMVHNELQDILQTLEQDGPDLNLEPVLASSVINVIWNMATGKRIPRGDPRLSRCLNLMNKRAKVFDMAGGILNQLPWLRYIMPEKTGYNLILRLNAEMKEFFIETINEHYDTWYEGAQDDLIYAFITEMKQNSHSDEAFTDAQLIMICLDLLIAGSVTTSNTLGFIFLIMLRYPEIQDKVAQELESTLKPDEILTYSHRLKLPYVEAVILEVERRFPIAPLIGPRRVLHDTILEGYKIPKNATVLISVYSTHHDPEYWGDPEVFRPERFMDENGKVILNERVINFGLGRRRCLGELLARQCIFLFFAGVLRKYKICPVPGEKLPSLTPLPGITLSPEKYKAHFIPREQ